MCRKHEVPHADDDASAVATRPTGAGRNSSHLAPSARDRRGACTITHCFLGPCDQRLTRAHASMPNESDECNVAPRSTGAGPNSSSRVSEGRDCCNEDVNTLEKDPPSRVSDTCGATTHGMQTCTLEGGARHARRAMGKASAAGASSLILAAFCAARNFCTR